MSITTSKEEIFKEYYADLHRRASPTPICTLLDIEYYRNYYRDSYFEDQSFIVEIDNHPVLAVITALQRDSCGNTELSAYGWPTFYVENTDCDAGMLQRAEKEMKDHIEKLLALYSASGLIYCDFLKGAQLSSLGAFLLDKGAIARPYFTQVIDLSKPEVLLREEIRKSYKSLINWGNNNLKTLFVDNRSITKSLIEDFRQLHIQAAGRETRAVRTWEIQMEQVLAKEAFIILGYMNEQLVTAAFFQYNCKSCLYGVSASKRDMFDKPMSHSLIWTAILHAKQLGCKCFEMGEQLYPGQGESLPTEKELGISKFKRGFGGETKVRLKIRLSR